MNRDIQLLGEELIKRKQEIAEKVHLNRMAGVKMTPKDINDFKKVEPKIKELRAEIIHLFGESLIHNQEQAEYTEKVRQWGKETGEYSFNLGSSLDEALKEASYYRRFIWEALKKEATRRNISSGVIFEVIDIIDPLLDEAVYYFSLTYVQSYKKVLDQAKSAFLELSVPIVPLVRGTGVLPLVGNIDTERAQHIMDETLTQALNLKLENLIIDLSGVMIVDTMVADQLYKVIDALSLLGVSTILTGIRPEVAQVMVTLGLDIDKFNVKGNLHQAFMEVRK